MPTYKLLHFDERGNESPQWGFANSRAPIQIFGGAYANGKTTALAAKFIKLAAEYPGSNLLLARSTYPKLNDTLRKVFMEWIPQGWIKRRPNQDDNTCYLHNGTTINFRYVAQRGKSNPDGSTTSNLLSATYDAIGVDPIEDPEIQYKDFIDLMGRLRGSTAYRPDIDDPTMPNSGPRWLCLTANPTSNWFYKDLIAPYLAWKQRGILSEKLLVDANTGIPILELFEGDIYSNRHNLTADYIRNLESTYKGQMRERYLMGKWAAFEGLVYENFSDANKLSREQIMKHLMSCKARYVKLQVREGYDFGLGSPSCYLYAFVDDYGRVFIIDGYYKPGFEYTEQPDAIRDIRAKYAHIAEVTDPIFADPDIFRKKVIAKVNTGTSVAALYREMGINMRPGNNDIISGIAKVSAYINGLSSTPHIITGDKPGPLLYVVDDLEWFFEEIDSYYWKKSPQGIHIDEPIDSNDHAMDTTKYMLSKLPDPSEIVTPSNMLPPAFMFWHESEIDQRRNNRRGM